MDNNSKKDLFDQVQIMYNCLEVLNQKHPCSELEQIHFLAGLLCDAVCNAEDKKHLSVQDKQRLTNQAVFLYLDYWLESDIDSTQTLYSFISQKFVPHENLERQYKVAPDETVVKQYQRGEAIFRKMMSMREMQAKDEGVMFKSLPQKNNNRRYYDFVSLYQIYMLARTHWLMFYDLLIGKKELLSVTHEKGSNKSLAAACNYYVDFFDHTEGLLNENKYKEYVVASIQAYKLETAYRFSLAIKIAQYMGSRGTENVDFMGHPFWARYQEHIWNDCHNVAIEDIDILSYDSLIPYCYRMDCESIEKATSQTIWREALTSVLWMLTRIKPPTKQPTWTEENYRLAAEFFQKEFNIIESLKPARPSNSDPYFYKNLRDLYGQLNKEEFPEHLRDLVWKTEMPLYEGRKTWQETRKQSNIPKSKAGD